MFFMIGITHQRKELDYYEPILCDSCSKYGRFEAYMEYNLLVLFFIPILKFNKKFYARTTCCNNIYLITNREKGLMMERQQGHNVFLKQEDIKLIKKGDGDLETTCENCGFLYNKEYKFCPNCGKQR